jgi:hypothetical protein
MRNQGAASRPPTPCATRSRRRGRPRACLPRRQGRLQGTHEECPYTRRGTGILPVMFMARMAMPRLWLRLRRATLAFRQRQFVASGAGRFILTFIMYGDIITGCYCGVPLCPRASIRCRVSDAGGQVLGGWWREAIRIATPIAGSPGCTRNKRVSRFGEISLKTLSHSNKKS